MAAFLKDSNSRLDYKVDWADPDEGPWLAEGEQIVTSTWIVPAGIVKDDEDNTATTATVWLVGGTAGQTYAVTNRIETNQGRVDDRTIKIFVTER